jgi:hypothetical protein
VHATAEAVATAAVKGAATAATGAAASKKPTGPVAALANLFNQSTKTKKQIMFQDKLCFAASLANVILSAFLFGFPRLFIYYFAVGALQ